MSIHFTLRPYPNKWTPSHPYWAHGLQAVTYLATTPPLVSEKILVNRAKAPSAVAVLTCLRVDKQLLVMSLVLSEKLDPKVVNESNFMVDLLVRLRQQQTGLTSNIYLFQYLEAKKMLGVVPDLSLYRSVPTRMHLKPITVDNPFGGKTKRIRVFDLMTDPK